MDLIKAWDKFREGDDDSFSFLFETYLDTLYRYGMKFVLDENIVKDCIHDLFIKLHTSRASLSSTHNPKFYLLRSLKHLIIDHINANKRLTYVSPENLPFIAAYALTSEEDDTNELDDETKMKFEKVMALLSPRQKEAIYLRFQLELSYEEIADLLNINYQSTRNLIHRSLAKVRENIELSLFLSLFLKVFS